MEIRQATQQEYQERVNRVVEYIHNHLDENIDLNKLAELSHFSPWHFHRIMKAFLREPLGAFIIRMRVETAARLLRHTDMSISEIAYRVGYEVPSSLSKTFRQFYDISPNEYRNNKDYTIMRPLLLNPELKLKEPKIQTIEPKQVIYIRLHGEYKSLDYCKAWTSLWEYVKKEHLFSAGIEHLCIYYNDPKVTEPDKLQTEVCLVLPKKAVPKGEIGVKEVAGGKYAVFLYQGSYQNLGTVYDTIYSQWLPASSYRLSSQPGFEKYLNHPDRTEPEKLKTEIYIPVED